MAFISVTRLRLRSIRFLPAFVVHTMRSLKQVKEAPGFQSGALLPDRKWTFWTLTAWDSEESMRAYIIAGPHKQAMPRLLHWCDEASIVHWTQPDAALPSWEEADRRMRSTGRPSKVNYPTPSHPTLTYATPRTSLSRPIRRP